MVGTGYLDCSARCFTLVTTIRTHQFRQSGRILLLWRTLYNP